VFGKFTPNNQRLFGNGNQSGINGEESSFDKDKDF
jgi:hypothetical protein